MIKLLGPIFISLLLSSVAHSSVTLTQLGKRMGSCKKTDSDDFVVNIDKSLTKEAQNLSHDENLSKVIINTPDCFRVGTEIQIFLENETIPYLGKALIDEIEILSSRELSIHKNIPYSKQSVHNYLATAKASRYGILKIRMTEKMKDYFVNQEYERLPTCFPTFGDWESFRIREDQKDILPGIKSGKTIAQIWNGTFNCYKVGIRARIQIEGGTNEDHGSVVPRELYVVHYTHLTSKHARLLGKSLSSLQNEMEKKKDIDGGYTTLIVFDYEKPREILETDLNE